jgi:hypothetical protein
MPDRITITQTLIKAESLEQFRYPSGKRMLCKPYFRKMKDGTLVFDFITQDTNVVELQRYIEQGCIYLVES